MADLSHACSIKSLDVTRNNSERHSSPLAKLKPRVFNPKMRNERSKKINSQQEIHPTALETDCNSGCEALKIPLWYTSPETMVALMTDGWNQEDKLREMVSDSTSLSELYDCSLLSVWSEAASVLVGMWSQLPTDTVTQDSSLRCSID